MSTIVEGARWAGVDRSEVTLAIDNTLKQYGKGLVTVAVVGRHNSVRRCRNIYMRPVDGANAIRKPLLSLETCHSSL